MFRKKKFIISLIAVILAVSASLGGVALAQDNEDTDHPDTLMERVADILGIDRQTVADAVEQAREEMQEEALDSYLQNLVDEGIITEEQAAEYKEWLGSKPDMKEYSDKIKEWMEERPDIPNFPRFKTFGITRGRDGIRIFGGFNSMDEMNIFDGLCLPSQ